MEAVGHVMKTAYVGIVQLDLALVAMRTVTSDWTHISAELLPVLVI